MPAGRRRCQQARRGRLAYPRVSRHRIDHGATLVTGSQEARHDGGVDIRKFGVRLVEVVATLHLAARRQRLPQGRNARVPFGAEDEGRRGSKRLPGAQREILQRSWAETDDS